MATTKSYSLVVRITLWAILFIFLFMGISTIVDYRIHSKRWYWSIEEQAAEIGQFVSLSLPPALWNYEMELVDRVLSSAVNSKVIDAIYLVEGEKFSKGFRQHNNQAIQTADSLPDGIKFTVLKIYYPDAGDEPIASVYFDINEGYVTEQMDVLVYVSIMRGLLLCLALAVSIYLLLRWLVRKPIHKLGNAMQDIARGEGDLTQRLSITQNNEIGALVGYFNQFMDKLQHSMSAIGKMGDQTRQAVDDLDKSLDVGRKLVFDQNGEINAIASAIVQSTASTQGIADNAQTASTAADTAYINIQKVQTTLDATIKLIQELDGRLQRNQDSKTSLQSVQTVELALNTLRSVIDSIGQINDMTSVIASEVEAQLTVARDLEQSIQHLAVLAQDSNDQLTQAGNYNASVHEQINALTNHLAAFKW